MPSEKKIENKKKSASSVFRNHDGVRCPVLTGHCRTGIRLFLFDHKLYMTKTVCTKGVECKFSTVFLVCKVHVCFE